MNDAKNQIFVIALRGSVFCCLLPTRPKNRSRFARPTARDSLDGLTGHGSKIRNQSPQVYQINERCGFLKRIQKCFINSFLSFICSNNTFGKLCIREVFRNPKCMHFTLFIQQLIKTQGAPHTFKNF